MVILARVVFAFIGALLGYSGSLLVLDTGALNGIIDGSYLVGLLVLGGVLVGLAVGPSLVHGLMIGTKKATQIVLKTPTHELVGGSLVW